MRASTKKYGIGDWAIAFLAVALCYAAGELCVWLFGLKMVDSPWWYRLVERTFYGTFPATAVGVVVVRMAFGKWIWQVKNI